MKTDPLRFHRISLSSARHLSWLVLALCSGLVVCSALADTTLVTTGSPVKVLVPADDSLGITWRGTAFDDSAWPSAVNGVGFETVPGAYDGVIVADSVGDWSSGGQQGENSWLNGYYDKTADADHTYQVNDFQPFPRADGAWDEDNFWNGSNWDWFPVEVPWDNIGQTFIHPNGENSGGIEHWSIRRWRSTVAGPVTVRFFVRKDDTSGAGVTGKIFHNGEEIFSKAVAGSDMVGYTNYVNLTVQVGDYLDVALTPVGPSGDTGDGSDGSVTTAAVFAGTITPPVTPEPPGQLASSVNDWVTGAQGENSWFYGYWDRTSDANGTYDPYTEFNTTDPNWVNSGAWVLGPGDPPWTTIGQTDWHPNGDNPIHWPIKRWVCTVSGDINVRVQFGKSNTGCGNGTTLHVLHNGVEKFARTVAGGDGTGFDTYVNLPGVAVGDFIEFALDPLGTDGTYLDGCDGSRLAATFYTGTYVPPYLAHSAEDWGSGAQGEKGWYYGFYNKTGDADGTYDANADFNSTDPNWTLDAGAWRLGPGDAPWDTIGQTEWHPNGINNTEIHFVIKRWVATLDGDIHCRVQFSKQSTGGGNGTTIHVYHNGAEKFSKTIAYNDGTGINSLVDLPGVFVGDKIDFALDPLGTDGNSEDGADGSLLTATIIPGAMPKPFVPGLRDYIATDIQPQMKDISSSVYLRFPFDVADPGTIETFKLKINWNDGYVAYLNGKEIDKRNAPIVLVGNTIADSMADWSTDPAVMVNGWEYGYSDRSLDADAYGREDFTPFPYDGTTTLSLNNFWNGGGWDWYNGNPPWTELYQEGVHPNAPNDGAVDPANVATHHHWVIRRWNATVDANLKCRVKFRKTNISPTTDGVTLYVFHNGLQRYAQSIGGGDGTGRDDIVDLPDVFIGDTIDIALSPEKNPDAAPYDWADGSAFSAVFFEGEPSIPWNAAATAARSTTDSTVATIIDLAAYIPDLRTGPNVLAIQGLNVAADDGNFLIKAELLANRQPTANIDTVFAIEGVPVVYPTSMFLANDVDPDNDSLLVVGVNPYISEFGGSVRLFGETVHYTSPPGFTGIDTFLYTMTDRSGTPHQAMVEVYVEPFPLNNPPSFMLLGPNLTTTVPGPASVPGWAFNISPGPESSEAGQSVTFEVTVDRPWLFAVLPAINPAGTLTYAPLAGTVDTATVTVVARDNGGTERGGLDTSAPQTFTLTLNLAPPCIVPPLQTVEVDENGSVTILLAQNAEGAGFAVTSWPAHGTLQAMIGPQGEPLVIYEPTPGYCGLDQFTFTVAKAGCPTDPAVVQIAVRCLNNCPTAKASVVPPNKLRPDGKTYEVIAPDNTNAVVLFDASLSADPDGDPLTYAWFEAPPPEGSQVPVPPGKKVSYKKESKKTTATCTFGKVAQLTLQYTGTEPDAMVMVLQKNWAIIFEGLVAPGATFTFTGTGKEGEMGSEIAVLVNGEVNAGFHTSGSQPIGPGLYSGDFLITEGYTRRDNELCRLAPPPLNTTVQFGDGLAAQRTLFLGMHTIVLEVSDGLCPASDQIWVEVITPGTAVEDLIALVDASNVARKETRPLIEILKKAVADFDKGKIDEGIKKLESFIKKVESKKDDKIDPATKAEFIAAAQYIIDAITAP